MLLEFERFSKAKRFSAKVAANRRDRILAIVRHAIPPGRVKPNPEQPSGKNKEGTLQYFACNQLPKLKPDLRPKTIQDYLYVANKFAKWCGERIHVANVTPDLIDQFEEAGSGQASAWRMRSLMRFYETVTFRVRSHCKKMELLNQGDGSAFLLANVYANRYELTAPGSRRCADQAAFS